MVAKMPLLISSRMMSAALTVSSSASSLTVIVPGSSIAPRSLGSSVWTCGLMFRRRDAAACAGRDGRGCRSYSWPRAPPSMVFVVLRSRDGVREERRGERGLERPGEGALLDGDGQAVACRGTRRRRDRQPAARVDDDAAVGRADDAHAVRAWAAPSGRRRRSASGPGAGCPPSATAAERSVAATTPPPRWRPVPRPRSSAVFFFVRAGLAGRRCRRRPGRLARPRPRPSW